MSTFLFPLAVVLLLTGSIGAEPFLPKQTAYDEALAVKLLSLSAGAYAISPDDCVYRTLNSTSDAWSVVAGTTNQICDGFANSCGFYIVVSNRTKELIVVFRGTKGKKQLLIEGWHSLKPGKTFLHDAGKVNKYFAKALESMWEEVSSTLQDNKYAGYSVIFTGHSLGGALASLASLRAVVQGIRTSDQVRLYTFGQPRVGNVAFARKHNALVPQSFRVVHRADAVPHMPACAKDSRHSASLYGENKPCDPDDPRGPYHHGTEIWYPNGMEGGAHYYECLGTPLNEDFHCSDSLTFEVHKFERYIFDHRYYFRHRVPHFGKVGCRLDSSPSASKSLSEPDTDTVSSSSDEEQNSVASLGTSSPPETQSSKGGGTHGGSISTDRKRTFFERIGESVKSLRRLIGFH